MASEKSSFWGKKTTTTAHPASRVSDARGFDSRADRPGVQDPCERDKVDVLDCCTDQQLEDITRSAQNVLLKIAFRQIHEVRTSSFGRSRAAPVELCCARRVGDGWGGGWHLSN